MHLLDWTVMLLTLTFIVVYGMYKSRQQRSASEFLSGRGDTPWFTVGLSVLATQASAITFLSAPGLGYESGLRFVQFYLGMPLAVLVVCIFFIPRFFNMKVLTAYEYLEGRFDVRVRLFTAFLFLLQRGFAAGLTIYAPSIILSTLFGWNLTLTNIAVGTVVIFYTTLGGTKAVNMTQKAQMTVIFFGLFVAFYLLIKNLTEHVSLSDSLEIAGTLGHMKVIDTQWDLNQRYTLWSGLLGGFFLSLSYFGTDQSQVQRYLSGNNIAQSRLGMLFNAMVKIPMQFFILLIGVLMMVLFQFKETPILFNTALLEQKEAVLSNEAQRLQAEYKQWEYAKTELLDRQKEEGYRNPAFAENFRFLQSKSAETKRQFIAELEQEGQEKIGKDTNYVFLYFVLQYLPIGLVGLLIAVILSAAMSSTAGELNALAVTTCIDFVKRLSPNELSDASIRRLSQASTLLWGIIAIGFALLARLFDNLIEMVNILGSLFYGTILGVFLVAFFMKKAKAQGVLMAAVFAQLFVLALHFMKDHIPQLQIEYLWYNVIGAAWVVLISWLSGGRGDEGMK